MHLLLYQALITALKLTVVGLMANSPVSRYWRTMPRCIDCALTADSTPPLALAQASMAMVYILVITLTSRLPWFMLSTTIFSNTYTVWAPVRILLRLQDDIRLHMADTSSVVNWLGGMTRGDSTSEVA